MSKIFKIFKIWQLVKYQNSKNFEFDGKLSYMYFEFSNNLNKRKNKKKLKF